MKLGAVRVRHAAAPFFAPTAPNLIEICTDKTRKIDRWRRRRSCGWRRSKFSLLDLGPSGGINSNAKRNHPGNAKNRRDCLSHFTARIESGKQKARKAKTDLGP